MENLKLYAKLAGILWLAGVKEACCLHRVVRLCISSRMLLIRTWQCFLLNGFIFLGSMLMLKSVVIPVLHWILPSQCDHLCGSGVAMALYSILRFILIDLFYIFWFYPLYVFSIVLSSIWYNDIAKQAFDAVKRLELSMNKEPSINDLPDQQSATHVGKPGGFEGVILGIGEQVYSILLLTIFFIEVQWYKWNHSELSLDKRLDFFESNWAFFLGFGSPCVLAIFFFSPLVSYGVMAILFPLFVLTAAGTQAEQVIESIRGSWGGRGPGKLQIFYASNTISMLLLQFFPKAQKEQ